MTKSGSPRQAQALFFRSILAFLEERCLLAEVVVRVSEPTRWIIRQPPWVGRWIPSLPIDEIESALQEIGGAELNIDLGRFTASKMVSSRLTPVLSGIFSVMGRSPEALFRSLNLCFSLATRGISFVYVPAERGGEVVAHFRGPGTPEGAFHVLRGALLHAFDLVGTRGTVTDPVKVTENEQGVTVRYGVYWP
jgi:hypothetical protein